MELKQNNIRGGRKYFFFKIQQGRSISRISYLRLMNRITLAVYSDKSIQSLNRARLFCVRFKIYFAIKINYFQNHSNKTLLSICPYNPIHNCLTIFFHVSLFHSIENITSFAINSARRSMSTKKSWVKYFSPQTSPCPRVNASHSYSIPSRAHDRMENQTPLLTFNDLFTQTTLPPLQPLVFVELENAARFSIEF